jgi:hypothetical protein
MPWKLVHVEAFEIKADACGVRKSEKTYKGPDF